MKKRIITDASWNFVRLDALGAVCGGTVLSLQETGAKAAVFFAESFDADIPAESVGAGTSSEKSVETESEETGSAEAESTDTKTAQRIAKTAAGSFRIISVNGVFRNPSMP